MRTQPPSSGIGRRLVILATALCLGTTGCLGLGSDSDGLSEAADAGSGSEAGYTPEEDGPPAVQGAVFDASGLPTTPIDPAWLTAGPASAFVGIPDQATWPDPIVDPCAAIDAATVGAIATSYDAFGREYPFVAESLGSRCRFTADTHVVDVGVHTPDALSRSFTESLPLAPGAITARTSSTAGDIEIFSDDAFGIDTLFATRGERGSWAVVVFNAGGTGLMAFSDEEEGWAEIADAALTGAQSLTPGAATSTATEGDVETDTGATAAPDPCAVYTPDELITVFGGVPLEETESEFGCSWAVPWERERFASLIVNLSPLDLATAEGDVGSGIYNDLGNGIHASDRANGTVVIRDSFAFRVGVTVLAEAYDLQPVPDNEEFYNARELEEVLVANILTRLGE